MKIFTGPPSYEEATRVPTYKEALIMKQKSTVTSNDDEKNKI